MAPFPHFWVVFCQSADKIARTNYMVHIWLNMPFLFSFVFSIFFNIFVCVYLVFFCLFFVFFYQKSTILVHIPLICLFALVFVYYLFFILICWRGQMQFNISLVHIFTLVFSPHIPLCVVFHLHFVLLMSQSL